MMEKIPPVLLRQGFLLLLIAGIAAALVSQLYWLTPALLSAYTLYVLLRRALYVLTQRWHWPLRLSALVLMAVSLAILALTVQVLAQLIGSKLAFLTEDPQQWVRLLAEPIYAIEARYNLQLLTPANIEHAATFLVSVAQRLFTATLSGLAVLVVGYFILYFMLMGSHAIERAFTNWLPLQPKNAAYLRTQLDTLVFSNALGIPLMGLVQALAGLPVYLLLGVGDVGLWFVATFIAGTLPFLGVALVYIPLSVLLFAQGQNLSAAFMLLYGFVVMGSVDNVARMWLMNKIGRTHPLVTLLGVIAGIPLFGFIGLIFGPILVSLFLILANLYVKEFSE